MKKLLKFLGVFLALLVVYAIFAMIFFDSHYHGENSITVNAPKEKVWTHVNSMKAFNTWNPWMKFDPNLKVTYSGISGNVGDKYHWIGNDDVGEGEQEITAIVPGEKVSTKMHFIKPMEDEATSDLMLASEGNATKVTWTIDFEMETYFKPMKPYMKYEMEKSYNEGLANLKKLVEQ